MNQIPISADKLILIKATPKSMVGLMKKRIEERVDTLNAQHRHQQKPPEYKTMTEALSRLPGGGVVVGKLTADEIRGMEEGNDQLLRKAVMLREKARKMARNKLLEGKSYQTLAKLQGQLPQSPYKDRDGYLEY
jgi:hypothetical protein